MEHKYKPQEASQYIGRSISTLQRLDYSGKLKAHRTTTNRRYYTKDQLDTFLGKKIEAPKLQIAYARVSSYEQKPELKHQLDYIRNYVNAKGIILDKEISDIDSGLNYKRKKWNQLMDLVEQDKVSTIYIAYKDRFIRFGYDWFDNFCKKHGCTIVVLNNPSLSPEEELTQDLLTILHVFSSRSYGIRKYQKQIKKELTEYDTNSNNQVISQ